MIGGLKVATVIKEIFVWNARATPITKANVTNMCDNWVGNRGRVARALHTTIFFIAVATFTPPINPILFIQTGTWLGYQSGLRKVDPMSRKGIYKIGIKLTNKLNRNSKKIVVWNARATPVVCNAGATPSPFFSLFNWVRSKHPSLTVGQLFWYLIGNLVRSLFDWI